MAAQGARAIAETGGLSLRRRRQPQDDVLVVIAEAAAEDVDSAGVAGVGLDLDLEPDRMMAGKIEVAQRHRRDFHAVDERALPRHAPALELAVLAALQLPPVRRVDAALVAEIAGAGPGPDFLGVDRDRDVGGPVRRG